MNNNLKLLYNPFTRLAGWGAFFAGLPIVCATVVLGWLVDMAIYGLEMKAGGEFTLLQSFAVTGTGLACTVGVMYLTGILFSRGVRFQDVLGTVTFARAPYLLAPSLGLIPSSDLAENAMAAARTDNLAIVNWGEIALIATFSILLLVWAVAMLWHAFGVSTGLKGGKAVSLFILSLLSSEILMLVITHHILLL